MEIINDLLNLVFEVDSPEQEEASEIVDDYLIAKNYE